MQRTQQVTWALSACWWQVSCLCWWQQHKCWSGYFCKDRTCVQRFIAPSLESNLYNIYTSPGTV